MNKTYAGIGSRNISSEMYAQCIHYGEVLGIMGYTLQSGGAPGSDQGFEYGADIGGCPKKIFLPWKGFSDNSSNLYTVSEEAYRIGEQFHPAWNKLSDAAKALISRNSYQVLGEDLKTPVDFIVCYTEGGKEIGGTAQGLRIARYYSIPVYNLGSKNGKELLDNYLNYVTLMGDLIS